jgi:glycine/D-amino acid oxidase-like deaminating enzyme
LNIGQVVIFANKEKILEVHAEFLIVGAGISGTSLALELHKRGSSVEIIDAYNPLSSSRVAAGMMNPMVPRNVQKAWHCDAIYPSVFEYYEEWQSLFGVSEDEKFIHRIETVQVHKNEAHTKNWTKRSRQNGFTQHLTPVEPAETSEYGIPLPFGAAICHLSGKLDVSVFLEKAGSYLHSKGVLIHSNTLNYNELIFDSDEIIWKSPTGTRKYKKIVFAEGVKMLENPWFSYLPLTVTGGDLIKFRIVGLPSRYILKRKEWLVPLGYDLWIGGSTFHSGSLSTKPDEKDLNELMSIFREWIPETYTLEVIDHKRAPRPTINTHRPFMGEHPSQKGMYIYNGLGSKGSSLVSLLSPLYAEHLVNGVELLPEVIISTDLET